MPTLFITGASRGLGLEFVRQYAPEGWGIIACCRHPEKASALQSLSKTYPSVRIEKLDVIDGQSIAELVAKLKDTPIDLLINGAGISSGIEMDPPGPSTDEEQAFGSIDPDAWMKVLRTNTVAPAMVAEAFYKNLLLGKGRMLVMISSRMGSIERTAREGSIAYRTSKAALNMVTKSLSCSLRDDKITVVSFHPGWVKTDMGGPHAEITAEESISGMKRAIAALTFKDTGHFFNYNGQPFPW